MRVIGRHHHNCENPWDEAPPWAIELAALGFAIFEYMEKKMSELDDKLNQNLEQVTAIKTRLDSLIAYQAGLKQQLDAALAAAGAGLTAQQRTVFDQVFAVHKATSDEIDEALNTNVPAPVA